jgi:hypothetical protein
LEMSIEAKHISLPTPCTGYLEHPFEKLIA